METDAKRMCTLMVGLPDVVPGKTAVEPCRWLAARPQAWRDRIEWATLDLSNSYRSVFDTMLPLAVQVADPFHVVKLASTELDECRHRVQNETCGHRGRRDDPLYRVRRRLSIAAERLSVHQHEPLVGLLRAGDPRQEVWFAWNAKEVVARHTPTPIPNSPTPGSLRSSGTSLMSRCPSRFVASDGPSSLDGGWHDTIFA